MFSPCGSILATVTSRQDEGATIIAVYALESMTKTRFVVLPVLSLLALPCRLIAKCLSLVSTPEEFDSSEQMISAFKGISMQFKGWI
jgi:hypothetical protein